MKKDIKDYLHLYLRQKVEYLDYYDNTRTIGIIESAGLDWFFVKENRTGQEYAQALLILRPLSDMTEDEAKDVVLLRSPIGSIKNGDKIVIVESMSDGKRIKWHFEGVPNIPRYVNTDELNPRQFQWLLSKGFDIFGLIDSGLAIDAATLKEKII